MSFVRYAFRLLSFIRCRWRGVFRCLKYHLCVYGRTIFARPCVLLVFFAALGFMTARLLSDLMVNVIITVVMGLIIYYLHLIFCSPGKCIIINKYVIPVLCVGVFLYFFVFVASERIRADRLGQQICLEDVSLPYRAKVTKVNYSVHDRFANSYTIRINEGVNVLMYTPEDLMIGDTIFVYASLEEHDESRNPGGFDARKYYNDQGLYYRIFATQEQIEVVKNAGQLYRFYAGAQDVVHQFKIFFHDQWSEWIGEENSSVFCAMTLGEKGWMSDALKGQFRDGHMSHLTAVSGLHIQSFIIPLLCIQQFVNPGRVIGRFGILLFLWSLAFVVNFSPSVTRAVIMYMMFLLSGLIGKQKDTINALFLSALIIAFFNPYAFSSKGFQLSFLATAGILVLAPKINERLEKVGLGHLASERLSSFLAVQIGIIPVMYFMSSKYSLPLAFIAILASLPAQFICVLSIPISVICFACRFHSSFVMLSPHLASPIRYLTDFTIKLAHVGGQLSLSAYNIRNISYLVVLSVLGLCGVILFKKCALKKCAVVLLSAFLLIGIVNQIVIERQKPLATIIFADVGQGDSAIILTQRHCVIIDGGNVGYGDRVLLPMLKYYSVGEPDIALLTHLHSDHYGGLADIMNSGRIKYLGTPYIAEDMTEFGFPYHAGDTYFSIMRGDIIQFCDNVMITVLSPEIPQHEGENEDSLVFLLEAGATSVLFTGDAGFPTEDELLRTNFLSDAQSSQIDILKVGHHGSRFSTSAYFLDEAGFETAVISVGTNFYGHPDPEVLERLQDAEIDTYRTDLCGAIIIEIYSDYYTVSSMIEREE